MTDKQHPGAIDVNGELYLRDAKGNLVPLTAVKPVDLLVDELVRGIIQRAQVMSDALAQFKVDAFEQIRSLQELLDQQYGATVGGAKGNIALTTFDGCQQVKVQVADLFDFGPELLTAKSLVDQCLTEWAGGSPPELRAIVNNAFSVEKEGQINRAGLLMLLKVHSDDPRWKRAMDAIRDSFRVMGSRLYMRCYRRPAHDGKWQGVKLDVASA